MKTNHAFKLFALVAAFVMIASGCHPTRQEAALTQHYEVNFNKADSTAITHASFTLPNTGTSILFEDRTRVTANGRIDSAIYSSTPTWFSWVLQNTREVTFVLRKDDNTLTNTASISSINDITLVMDSVLHTGSVMYGSFIGAPAIEGERIGLSMNRNSDSTGLWSGLSADITSQSFSLDIGQTRNFYPGTYTVMIARTRSIPVQQSDRDAGGYINITITDSKQVVVKP